MRGALGRAPTRARLLPPDITDFTGRAAELAALTDPAALPPHAAALFAVTGAGGTGKTALAVRAARLVGPTFPDAHLYADLGGYTGAPVPVPDVLRRFLRALGADGPLPPDPDELVGMFRTALAGQRALVVLDDAADEAQVRPLLPTGPDALAIVTSRNWLGGLAGAVPLRLGPLPEAEAEAMLARMLGPRWTGQEDAGDLLALCGHLPLAVRIAAARLLSRPQMTVEDLCDQLRDEGRRLKRLTAGDITVHGVLTSSYEALEPGDQTVFRRLALLPGFDFCTEAAALTAGIVREEAQEALDRLADRSVVRAESPPGRYSLHSLARLFAADRLADEDSETVRAAGDRHVRWVLARLHAAAEVVNPCLVRLPREEPAAELGTPFDRESALAWLDAERHNLLALVRRHRRTGDPAVCWTVPDALRGYFFARRHLREWGRMAGIGLAAARYAGDLRAQAAMHLSLGMAECAAERVYEAEDHFHRTVEFGLASGWREGEAAGYRNLADVAMIHGDNASWEKYLSLWADLKETLGRCPLPAEDDRDDDTASAADRGTAPSADWASLSHREQTVARLVVQGLTNQQIAKRIRCSPETVKFHLRNIFRKLDIGSRVEIARFVLSPGGSM
ncbi:LuxR C-terminal-related transcriptional regulator [Catenulispora subtropica]|uniref:HTH luxR-type domain-containing protein n=1 Tax=Catenulispora subtropica TaxID=450798 RepID=A0ABP5EN79_9ACTN